MAGNISWKDNSDLQHDMKSYLSQNFDFAQRDYIHGVYATLDRRLRHVNIHYINYDTPISVAAGALQQELDGPGRLLMNRKLRTEHNVQVPRYLVYNMMTDLDPNGLEARKLQKRRKKPKGHFVWRARYGLYLWMDTTSYAGESGKMATIHTYLVEKIGIMFYYMWFINK